MASIVLAGATSGSTTIQPTDAVTVTCTLPSTGGTLQTSGSGFTTNGVAYATSTSALATGSALTFNGSVLAVSSSTTDLITWAAGGAAKTGYLYSDSAGVAIGDTAGVGGNNTYYNKTSNYIANYTNGSEKMRLTSAGYLGIGTTSPGRAIEIYNSSAAMKFNNGTYNWTIGTGSFIDGSDSFNILSATLGGVALRVDSSGNLLVGTTSQVNSGLGTFSSSTARPALSLACTTANQGNNVLYIQKYDNTTTTGTVFVAFAINNGGSGSGQINANGAGAAAFGSYSDARLKTNIVELPSQLDKILALKPSEFDYIESEGGGHQIGFIAQEIQVIYPDAVGERNDGMLTVTGWSKTEARLVKAIQELNTLVTTQSAEIAALKAKVGA